MTQLNLVDSFKEFKEFKNIDREVMMGILEDVFRAMILKKYGDDSNFDIIINPDKGDLEIWRNRVIVGDGEVEDENEEIALSEALKIEDDFEVGEEVSEEIKLESFGRRNVLSLRQNLAGRIMDLEKDAIYQLYKERVGEVITGVVRRFERHSNIIVDLGDGVEAVLPNREQTPRESYRPGDRILAYLKRIDREARGPQIVLSRGDHHSRVGLMICCHRIKDHNLLTNGSSKLFPFT